MDDGSISPDAGVGGGEGEGPALDEYVTISRRELEALRARPAAAEEGANRVGPVPRNWEEQIERELASRDRRVSELEQSCRAAIRDRELATALAGKPLVDGAASQLIKLWRDELDVYEEGGVYKVAARDGRTVTQAVGEWLRSPEYSHFCLPTARGGTGARDANRPSAGNGPPAAPRNLGESVVMKWREGVAARPDNLLKPIGLRRHR